MTSLLDSTTTGRSQSGTGRSLCGELDLTSFLWFGYSIDPGGFGSSLVDLRALNERREGPATLEETVELGLRCLREAMAAALEPPRGQVFVPLSGGIESRMILAIALEHLPASEVATYTYGVPGTMDFEFGNAVARRAGTRHRAFDLNDCRYDLEGLAAVARRLDARTILFHYRPAAWLERELGCEGVHFNGIIGGRGVPAAVVAARDASWEWHLRVFSGRRRFTRSVDPLPPHADLLASLPRRPPVDPRLLSYHDQLELLVHNEFGIRRFNLSERFAYRVPFADPVWLNFIYDVPLQFREERLALFEMAKRLDRSLFALPCKSFHGLPIDAPPWRVLSRRLRLGLMRRARRTAPWLPWRRPASMINYLDFDLALRERADLRTVVRACLADLKHRGIVDWLDVDALWARHERRRANHADVLTMLASLEINLKVREGSA